MIHVPCMYFNLLFLYQVSEKTFLPETPALGMRNDVIMGEALLTASGMSQVENKSDSHQGRSVTGQN